MKNNSSYVSLIAKILVAINVVAFLYTKINGDLSDPEYLFNCGANNWDAVFNYGEYYRLITSMFLHTGWVHLIMNMLFILVFSTYVVTAVGKVGFVVVYFASGIAAGLISAYINMVNNNMIVSVGASGVVYGLMGAVGIIVLFTKNEKHMLFGPFAYAILTFAVGVDVIAHFGGIIGGIIISLFYIKQIKAKKDSIIKIFDEVNNS